MRGQGDGGRETPTKTGKGASGPAGGPSVSQLRDVITREISKTFEKKREGFETYRARGAISANARQSEGVTESTSLPSRLNEQEGTAPNQNQGMTLPANFSREQYEGIEFPQGRHRKRRGVSQYQPLAEPSHFRVDGTPNSPSQDKSKNELALTTPSPSSRFVPPRTMESKGNPEPASATMSSNTQLDDEHTDLSKLLSSSYRRLPNSYPGGVYQQIASPSDTPSSPVHSPSPISSPQPHMRLVSSPLSSPLSHSASMDRISPFDRLEKRARLLGQSRYSVKSLPGHVTFGPNSYYNPSDNGWYSKALLEQGKKAQAAQAAHTPVATRQVKRRISTEKREPQTKPLFISSAELSGINRQENGKAKLTAIFKAQDEYIDKVQGEQLITELEGNTCKYYRNPQGSETDKQLCAVMEYSSIKGQWILMSSQNIPAGSEIQGFVRPKKENGEYTGGVGAAAIVIRQDGKQGMIGDEFASISIPTLPRYQIPPEEMKQTSVGRAGCKLTGDAQVGFSAKIIDDITAPALGRSVR